MLCVAEPLALTRNGIAIRLILEELGPSMRHAALLSALSAALLASGLGACSSNPKAERQYVEQPVEKIYNEGADFLDQRRWTEAISAFDEVERQHPFSSWARRSILMGAYARYQLDKYDEAVTAAQRFIALHPGSDSAAYAYYLVALCNFDQIFDVGRDQSSTQAALQALDEVVRRFPNSEYARDARFKAEMTNDQLAGKEMDIGRFYLKADQHLAAANRFLKVIENPNYQTTTHAPEALHRLVEAYLSMGLIEEATKTAAVLGYNYPSSEWYERTYKLVTSDSLPVPEYGRGTRKAARERAIQRKRHHSIALPSPKGLTTEEAKEAFADPFAKEEVPAPAPADAETPAPTG